MAKQKFTVMLIPDGDGYQAIFPYYDNAIASGDTPEETLANAKAALESVLRAEAEEDGDPVPYNVHATHVVIGEVEADVPESLMGDLREAEAERVNASA